MQRQFRGYGLLSLLILAVGLFLSPMARAEDAAGPGQASKPEKADAGPAALKDVNFTAEFGGKTYYLDGLGQMIDRGRRYNDPTTLAMATLLLRRAEVETGKKSTQVTSDTLIAEAENLALSQQDPHALKAVADVLRDRYFGLEQADRAANLDKKAAVFLAQQQGSERAGWCSLVIKNKTKYTIDIYVNDGYVGTIDPYDTRKTSIRRGSAKLKAQGVYDAFRWGPSFYDLSDQFTWTLND